jgi:hypothetical protein
MSTHRFSDNRLLSIRDHGEYHTYAFHCPGCNMSHLVRVGGPFGWTFNGDESAPTFGPSILVQGTVPLTDDEVSRILDGGTVEPKPLWCHSFVEHGHIRFLTDCTHALAGSVVPMVPLPHDP